MKTIKVNELEFVYEATLEAVTYLSSDKFKEIESLSSIFAPSFLAYGSTEAEKIVNIQDFNSFLKRQKLKIQHFNAEYSVKCTPTFRSYAPDGQAAVYVDEIKFSSLLKESFDVVHLRVTIVLYKLEQGWRVTHIHISNAEAGTSEPAIPGKQESDIAEKISGLENEIEKRTSALNEALVNLQANQAQLVRMEKLAGLGQLTAGIAHEIKNPLNFINNFSELSTEFLEEIDENLEKLEAGEIKEEIKELLKDVKVNLEKIHHHGTRADGIVKSMLLHSRGGNGKMEDTDLNALIKEYVNLSFHGMRANKNPINVDIKVETDDTLKSIKLNPENFSRVILNLCKNAFDAMREKQERTAKYLPQLLVKTEATKDGVLVILEDNGPGVPEAIREKLMLPFFTTKKGSEGTGLGLSISLDIIKAHGGTLEVDSKEGEYTRFIISLKRKE